jgi:hypothetical protein
MMTVIGISKPSDDAVAPQSISACALTTVIKIFYDLVAMRPLFVSGY